MGKHFPFSFLLFLGKLQSCEIIYVDKLDKSSRMVFPTVTKFYEMTKDFFFFSFFKKFSENVLAVC